MIERCKYKLARTSARPSPATESQAEDYDHGVPLGSAKSGIVEMASIPHEFVVRAPFEHHSYALVVI